ncbi:MAG TPA: hypothetical protein VGX45_02455 [Solirubrobacteraceae bacterium]|nr:hypothetical protein [Solirubrobacteraceae bacterium]
MPRTEVSFELTPSEFVMQGDGEGGRRIAVERTQVRSIEWRMWTRESGVTRFNRIVFRDANGGPVGWWDLGLGPINDRRVVRWLEQCGYSVATVRGADALTDVVIAGRKQAAWDA